MEEASLTAGKGQLKPSGHSGAVCCQHLMDIPVIYEDQMTGLCESQLSAMCPSLPGEGAAPFPSSNVSVKLLA